MEKMDSVERLQQQSKQDRTRLIAGVSALGVLVLILQVVGVAPVFAVPLIIALFAGAGYLVMRLAAKMEKDSFDEGMRTIVDITPMVCTLYDKNNTIKYCNDKAPELFGFRDRQEYSNKYSSTFPDLQPDGTSSEDMATKSISQVMRDGSGTFEWWQKSATGELIPLRLTCVKVYFQGETHMMEFTVDLRLDLEVQKKREEAVKERMQVLLDAAPMLCGIYDEDGNALEINKEAERLFGISDKQIFAKNFGKFVPQRQPDGQDSIQKNTAILRRALKDGYARYEWVYLHKDGTPIPTEELMSRAVLDGKSVVICYSRDLRAEHASREAEQRAQKMVNVMVERLNEHLETQAAAITESSAAIEEMIANTRSVSNTLSKNSENVKELQQASTVGHSGLNEVANDIREIAKESESLLEINSVMQSIARQTNLLSMNASIEAAHAGESGRGFAVVADEIRKLAESSSVQSKTISAVLKKIKESIDNITKSTDNVMNNFGAIEGGVRIVAEQEDGILNAMTEQGAGSVQIMQAISQVNDITSQVKEDARQMVEAAAKLGA